MKTYKGAGVYLRENSVLMYPENVTTQGVGVGGQPTVVVSKEDPKSIGENLLRTIEASGNVILHPEDWSTFKTDHFWKDVGVRSYKEFVRGAKYLSITAVDGKYILQLTKNGGAIGKTRGFHGLPEKDRVVSFSNPEELGRAVLAAFDDCE